MSYQATVNETTYSSETIEGLRTQLLNLGIPEATVTFLMSGIEPIEDVVETVVTVTEDVIDTTAEVISYMFSAEGLVLTVEGMDDWLIDKAQKGYITVDEYFSLMQEWIDYRTVEATYQALLDRISALEEFIAQGAGIDLSGFDAIGDTIADLRQQVADISSGLETASVDIVADLGASIGGITETITSITDRITEATADVISNTERIDAVNEVLEGVTSTLDQLTTDLADLTAVVEKLGSGEGGPFAIFEKIALAGGLVIGGIIVIKVLDVLG